MAETDRSNMRVGGHLWREFITIFDFVLLPFYLALVFAIAISFRNRWYRPSHPWRKYFMWGFSLKVIGAILIGLVYQYYYSGGDTSAYFYHANVINQSLDDSIIKWFNLIFHIPDAIDPGYYEYTQQMMWYKDPSTYMVCAITAVINLFTFNTYLPSNIIFAALAFSGSWALFRTFAQQYPKLVHPLAIAFLFIPSVIMWGSGIFKDTVCLAALGWMTHFVFKMLIQKKVRLSYLIITAICFYLLAVIKVYILLVFVPALMLWVFNTYSHKIKQASARFLVRGIAVVAIGIGFVYFAQVFSKELGAYSLENVAETSTTTREYILWVSGDNEGSGYDLGAIEPTPLGMLKKFPQSVNVTLFRPYLWEAGKPIVFLNALEAFLFLFFTFKILVNLGFKGIWQAISKNPNIQFFLLFTIIFAFAVGISSYNFGALSRYRIPCLPFYAAALVLMYYSKVPASKPFFTYKLKD